MSLSRCCNGLCVVELDDEKSQKNVRLVSVDHGPLDAKLANINEMLAATFSFILREIEPLAAKSFGLDDRVSKVEQVLEELRPSVSVCLSRLKKQAKTEE